MIILSLPAPPSAEPVILFRLSVPMFMKSLPLPPSTKVAVAVVTLKVSLPSSPLMPPYDVLEPL